MSFKLFMVALPVRAQELCESRGGRPGLPVPNGLLKPEFRNCMNSGRGGRPGFLFS